MSPKPSPSKSPTARLSTRVTAALVASVAAESVHTEKPDGAVGSVEPCQPMTRSGLPSPLTSPAAGKIALNAGSAAAETAALAPRTDRSWPRGWNERADPWACAVAPGLEVNCQKDPPPGAVSTQSVKPSASKSAATIE